MTSPTRTNDELATGFASFWSRFPYRTLRVGSNEWRYIDTERGNRTVLMLPGGSYRPDNYFELIDDLARDFRIIAPAYPPVYPMREVLRGVSAILDSSGQTTVTVFGCSFGGYVAQAMVKDVPDRVETLILAQTATRHFAGLRTMRLFSALFSLLPLPLIRAFTWRLWTRWFTASSESHDFWFGRLRSQLNEMSKPQHVAGVRNIVDFMDRYHPAAGWLAPWSGRVLILESMNDQAFSAENRQELRAAYPDAVVRSLDAGHTALFTDSTRFTNEIRDFLASPKSSGFGDVGVMKRAGIPLAFDARHERQWTQIARDQ